MAQNDMGFMYLNGLGVPHVYAQEHVKVFGVKSGYKTCFISLW